MKKTNALRILDQHKIKYEVVEYEYEDNHVSKDHIFQSELSPEHIYKTIVLKATHGYIVCCIPVLEEIDLKKLARESGNKSVEMVHQKDLLNLTGYIRGGCSPAGMKKKFPTYFQQDMKDLELVAVSAGKQGMQMILKPIDLLNIVEGKYVDVIKK